MKVNDRPVNSAGIGSTNESTKPQAKNLGDLAKSGETGKAGASVEISDNARLMNKAKELAMKAPDMRADKVAALKKGIREGSYQVDSAGLADRILQDHLDHDFGKNRI